MKILYFTFIENPFAPENQGVMRGQVINVLKSIATNYQDIEVHWLALINTMFYNPSGNEIADLQSELKESNVNLIITPIPDSVLKRNKFAVNELSKYVEEINPDIIHCRVYPSTLIALDVRKNNNFNYKVIFDARGVYPEQILERSSNIIGKIRYHYWKHLEKSILNQSDLTVGVTTAFVSHFKKISSNAKLKYIPCCVQIDNNIDTNKSDQLKSEVGYSIEDKIAVYSGNLSAKYSSLEQIVEVFHSLHINDNQFKFLVLTKSNTDELENMLTSKKLFDKTKILNLKPQEVRKYLSICNLGVLFRNKSLVNEVAMPTKFAEYISCGLPVIVSDSIKGVAEIVEENNLGIVLSENQISKSEYEKLLFTSKEHCISYAKNFSTEAVANQYYSEYKDLAL